MQQEVFDFHKIERLDWSDFIEGNENREAISYLVKWPNWNSNGIIIYGESGTGKTHLAALWAQTANAVYVLKDSLNYDSRDLFDADCNFVIDNFDDTVRPENYNWIFHFLNIAKEKNRFFLLLSRSHPLHWNVELQDLRSRLFALSVINIDVPKDDLLLKISQKIARDLEITISDEAMMYILNMVERRVNPIANILKTLDKLSLQQKKALSFPFIKSNLKILDS
ncbi:MAG: hypothetical protein LBF54_02180 [Holosporaceae bacterium]|jgi:chromosomal replication initiation ATPase DnaA|nr:hypothetical protein [Holosporaceae bacterium]